MHIKTWFLSNVSRADSEMTHFWDEMNSIMMMMRRKRVFISVPLPKRAEIRTWLQFICSLVSRTSKKEGNKARKESDLKFAALAMGVLTSGLTGECEESLLWRIGGRWGIYLPVAIPPEGCPWALKLPLSPLCIGCTRVQKGHKQTAGTMETGQS